MLLKTILNRCQKFKCFVYSEVKFTDHQGSACIEAWIEPRKNSKAICSGCGTAQPGYDTNLEPRRFEFIPVWGIPVFFLYFMRRVDCKMCGVRTEQVPWGEGKKQLTKVYMQYLANWAQVLPWQEVARRFSHELGEGFPLSRVRRRMGS
jgi:transposase